MVDSSEERLLQFKVICLPAGVGETVVFSKAKAHKRAIRT